MGLGDEERGSICLTSTLDRTTGKLLEVNSSLVVNPSDSTTVADEHLELVELCQAQRFSQWVREKAA